MKARILGILKYPGRNSSRVVFRDDGNRLRVEREDSIRLIWVDLPSTGVLFSGSIDVNSIPNADSEIEIEPEGMFVGGELVEFDGAEPADMPEEWSSAENVDVSVERVGRQTLINGMPVDGDVVIGGFSYQGKTIKPLLDKGRASSLSFAVTKEGVLIVRGENAGNLALSPLDTESCISF